MVYPTLITHYYNTIVQPGSANGTGVWNFILDSFPGNTAVDIYAISEVGTLALEDILFGDVWICSGQSNMQFTVIQVRSYQSNA